MPSILCIETSSNICSVAIEVNQVVYFKESVSGFNHSEHLSTLIQSCLHSADISLNKLDAIALSDGPGSYTGLRIGASTAKGICYSLNIPLIAISTLKSIALACKSFEKDFTGLYWPMIDARRMEVYHSVYDNELNELFQPINGIITEEGFNRFTERKDILLCGDGAMKANEILNLKAIDVNAHAKYLCKLAQIAFENNEFQNIESYQPFYLKQANITISVK